MAIGRSRWDSDVMRNGTGKKRHTLLVADDHPVMAEGLAMALAPFFTIVGFVTTLDAISSGIDRHQPDLVVLDLMFDGGSSLPVMREQIHDREVTCRFVVLTAHDSETFRTEALTSGAAGFLSKGVSIQELRRAIDEALAGREVVPPARLARDVGHRTGGLTEEAGAMDGVRLRRRQVQVLLLLYDGWTRVAIADRLGITARGVDYHLALAKEAVGIANLRLLARWAGEHVVALRSIRDEGTDPEDPPHTLTLEVP